MRVSKSFLFLFIVALFISQAKASELEFAYGGLKFDYNEYSQNGTWLDSETSDYDMQGWYLKYTMPLEPLEKYSQELEFFYSYHEGDTLYSGHLQNLSNGVLIPYEGSTMNYLFQGHTRYKVYTLDNKNEVGIFTGLGYRYWDRDLKGAYGYLETYQWAYYELGLNALWWDGNWFTGFEFSYQKAYKPVMKAYLNGGLDFDLGETSGVKLRVPFGYEINKNYKISLVYVYDKWDISRSNVVRGFVEPRSETANSYLYLGLEYTF